MKKTVGVAISLLLMANALFAQAKSLDKNNAYYVYLKGTNTKITDEEYLSWQSQMKITNLVSLNEYIEQGSDVSNEKGTNVSRHFDSPEKTVEKSELAEMLKSALTLLTEKERRVIELYYYEELTMKEISHILEVTESRVSQLHTRGLQKMKTKMGDYMDFLSGI